MNVKEAQEAQAKYVLNGEATEVHADAPYTLVEYERLRAVIWDHFIDCSQSFSDGECFLCKTFDNWMRSVSEERKRAEKMATKQTEMERKFKDKVRATGLWYAD